ncbi:hypothetical protein KSP40_PGU017806 [Platanthera guangdongensis]|uniref:Uncharacterized protein n=1 Tax=Platanthera guangdongensis TaxID=2320717 RepID=A0ABR2M8J1_9ASPA
MSKLSCCPIFPHNHVFQLKLKGGEVPGWSLSSSAGAKDLARHPFCRAGLESPDSPLAQISIVAACDDASRTTLTPSQKPPGDVCYTTRDRLSAAALPDRLLPRANLLPELSLQRYAELQPHGRRAPRLLAVATTVSPCASIHLPPRASIPLQRVPSMQKPEHVSVMLTPRAADDYRFCLLQATYHSFLSRQLTFPTPPFVAKDHFCSSYHFLAEAYNCSPPSPCLFTAFSPVSIFTSSFPAFAAPTAFSNPNRTHSLYIFISCVSACIIIVFGDLDMDVAHMLLCRSYNVFWCLLRKQDLNNSLRTEFTGDVQEISSIASLINAKDNHCDPKCTPTIPAAVGSSPTHTTSHSSVPTATSDTGVFTPQQLPDNCLRRSPFQDHRFCPAPCFRPRRRLRTRQPLRSRAVLTRTRRQLRTWPPPLPRLYVSRNLYRIVILEPPTHNNAFNLFSRAPRTSRTWSAGPFGAPQQRISLIPTGELDLNRSLLSDSLSRDAPSHTAQSMKSLFLPNSDRKDVEVPIPPLVPQQDHAISTKYEYMCHQTFVQLASAAYSCRSCSAVEVLTDLVRAASALASKRARSLELSELHHPLLVAVDESALRQALSNLIEGSLLRTRIDGKVEIYGVTAPAGGALVLIDDNGPDMHYMTQMHALTPFGTGLLSCPRMEDNMTWNFVAGLAVAREILESYGCVVRVISPRELDAALGAGGTRIELWFPDINPGET